MKKIVLVIAQFRQDADTFHLRGRYVSKTSWRPFHLGLADILTVILMWKRIGKKLFALVCLRTPLQQFFPLMMQSS